MKIYFLGVWMTPECGETVSFAIELDTGEKILIDTANNPVHQLVNMGINPIDISDVILTHIHGDHISGLPMLLFHRINYLPLIGHKEEKEINIIGSEQCLSSAMEYLRIPYPGLASSGKFTKTVLPDIPTTIKYNNQYDFTFFEANHVPMTTGFILTDRSNGKKLMYSGDTTFSENILDMADGVDCLIHDVAATKRFSMLSKGHCLCEEIVPALSKRNIKMFIPVHRMPYYNVHINEYLLEFDELRNTKLILPNDGDVIVI